MAHIFLSYAREDTDFMHRLRDDLRAEGLDVWTDETGLVPGTASWEQAILAAIREAGCMVVVLSPDAFQSPWVGRELIAADEVRLRIFPMLARGDAKDAVPLRLKAHQRMDARQNYGDAARQLTDAICSHLDVETLAQRQQREAEEAREREDVSTTDTLLLKQAVQDELYKKIAGAAGALSSILQLGYAVQNIFDIPSTFIVDMVLFIVPVVAGIGAWYWISNDENRSWWKVLFLWAPLLIVSCAAEVFPNVVKLPE